MNSLSIKNFAVFVASLLCFSTPIFLTATPASSGVIDDIGKILQRTVNPEVTYEFSITNGTGSAVSYSINLEGQPPLRSGYMQTHRVYSVGNPQFKIRTNIGDGRWVDRSYSLYNGGRYRIEVQTGGDPNMLSQYSYFDLKSDDMANGSTNTSPDKVVATQRVVLIKTPINDRVFDFSNSERNGEPVILFNQHNGKSQQWRLVPLGNGYHIVKSMVNGRVLDFSNSSRNGEPVILFDEHDGNSQQWKLEPLSNGRFLIVSKVNGRVLDFSNSSRNGEPVILFDRHGGASQQWIIE